MVKGQGMWIIVECMNFVFKIAFINRHCFNSKSLDDRRANQTSGVSIVAGTMQFSNAKDKNPIYEDMTYYGIVKEIWELDYWIPIFKCDWVESNNQIKVDKLGFTCVILKKVEHKDDPFILAFQANQVFYVDDLMESGWSIAISAERWNIYPDND